MTTSKIVVTVFAAASLAVLLNACTAGNGTDLDENGRPLSESQSNTDPATGGASETGASSQIYTRIQDEILTPECATSGCHNGTSSPLGLNLVSGKSYDKMVGKMSNQIDGLQLVEPYNSDASYLVQKIEGASGGGGGQMPLGKPPLSADQMQLIRDWIDEGALPVSTDSNVTAAFEATLTDIQKYVFDIQCKSCHSGDNPAGTLNLEKGKSYDQLVGRALQFDPDNSILVVAGDSNNSFLINKLTGVGLGNSGDENYKGLQMPLGGPYIEDSSIAIIKQWIDNGAENN